MKQNTATILVGILLVLAGILFLLNSFNVLTIQGDGIVALLFAAGGAIFLGVFAFDVRQWWAVIPGFTLLAIGGLIGLPVLLPGYNEDLGGALFLGALALSFWLIFAFNREFWWAVIPAGVLTTLAVVAGISTFPGLDQYTGGIFFLGLAATFGLLTLLPTREGNLRWAIYPAAVLLVLAAIVFAATSTAMRFFWPVVLIVGGIIVLYFAMRPRTR